MKEHVLCLNPNAIPVGEAAAAIPSGSMPRWLLVLIILFLAAALFSLAARFIFRKNDGTPDSPVYALIFFLVRLWHGRRPRPEIRDERLGEAEPPYILLANHESFFDFYYIHQMAHPRNPTFLVNEFYTTRPVLKTLSRRAGILSKKLFTTELSSPVRIMRTLKDGHSVVIFPEGRLSPDGRSNPIVEEGGAFYKRMNADIVLVKINGAYFADPKWRKKRFRSSISVTVEDVIKKETLASMPADELNEKIASTLWNDASENVICRYPQQDKAAGLETILYRCADCGALYTIMSEGNRLVCSACGTVHALDEQYRFTEAPFMIGAWYDRIREAEEKELDTLSLHCSVRTLIHGKDGGKNRKEKGECFLTPETFTYRSESGEFSIPTEKLPALAFSCATEFELYHDGELYYFYPETQPQQTARWGLAVDLLTERRRKNKKKETV
ncbi:MAG: 1-acyl-sn-glycerol-3-phosphate acyltransferase [Oscillospiraceae bacterium]|nr:1-acyl-sn-glycerol-3-phosphate acyltransferase [Oscillospiraceae bacterium]